MDTGLCCSCRGLSKSYGRKQVLSNCNLELKPGELVGLIGENGSGKSTLVQCLLGYTAPDKGTVRMWGTVGYCPQEMILNRAFTLQEHLTFSMSVYEQHAHADTGFASTLLEEFRLTDYMEELIKNLSGGTRQKLQFITSILHRPSLLIMDEPYDGFDWEMYLTFWDVIERLRQAGTGILLISHLLYDRDKFDRILALKEGGLHAQ
ncbi:ABC transporter ATP-binding protein [Balneolaceae bacterium YR4-1]|uniref:ABC transporter ATP-binding protein n=1 Tax=Halalkalibaculum roseum TaxID=2709311 RepID=A0A6M1SS86_9BACT|nr:ABC transporter ATP-binding protein [Halalkalibaculum roseum]NGP75046.1 ABC transporter ATP-binding protein [Halalkalibaculum roseum]